MKSAIMLAMVLSMVLSISIAASAQTKPEQKAETASDITEAHIVNLGNLPIVRSTEPWELFDQAVKDEQGRCKVHHQPLTVALVPIAYGLRPCVSREYCQTESKKFPNAITEVRGGCLMTATNEAKVLQCQKCLAVKKKWLNKHGSKYAKI